MKTKPVIPQKYKDEWHDVDFESLWLVDMIYLYEQLSMALDMVADTKLNKFKEFFDGFKQHYCFEMSCDELKENYGEYSQDDFTEAMRKFFESKK